MVILLLGVLSVFAASKMVSSATFVPSMIVQEGVAFSRFAQQLGQSRQDAQVRLFIEAVGSDWRFRVETDVAGTLKTLRSQTLSRKNSSITVSDGLVSGSIGGGSALILEFDGLGGLSNARVGTTLLDTNRGIQLSATGDSQHALCIGPVGYAYHGACT